MVCLFYLAFYLLYVVFCLFYVGRSWGRPAAIPLGPMSSDDFEMVPQPFLLFYVLVSLWYWWHA